MCWMGNVGYSKYDIPPYYKKCVHMVDYIPLVVDWYGGSPNKVYSVGPGGIAYNLECYGGEDWYQKPLCVDRPYNESGHMDG